MKRTKLLNYKIGNFKKVFNKKFLYIFLDYDGTLSAIVKDPKKARISAYNKDLIKRLSGLKNCKVAIISGRSSGDVKARVGIKNIIYAGNHGLEIKGPGIKFTAPLPRFWRKNLSAIKKRLIKGLSGIPGVIIEDKKFSISVHYRQVLKKDILKLKKIFSKILISYPKRCDLIARPGKMIFEIRPVVKWDKGVAILWILERERQLLHEERHDIFPIYIGDDATDEDAFRALKSRGMAIFVGEGPTMAKFRLADTKDVTGFLREAYDAVREG